MTRYPVVKGGRFLYRGSVEDDGLTGTLLFPTDRSNTTVRDPLKAFATTALVAAFTVTSPADHSTTNYILNDRSGNETANGRIGLAGRSHGTTWPAINPPLAHPAQGELERNMLQLRTEMQAQFRALNERIDRITPSSRSDAVVYDSEPQDHNDATNIAEIDYFVHNGLLDLAFNSAADTGVGSSKLSDLAKRNLTHDLARVRSSAARALAALSPSEAAEILPQVITNEKNRISRTIMISALRAASL